MKPYAVVQYNSSIINDMRIPGYQGAARHCFFPHAPVQSDNGVLSRDSLVFYCDDEHSAVHLAQKLATTNVGISYGVVKTTTVYVAQPGPILGTKWTDKGLLPI